jgi:hypothetical protein
MAGEILQFERLPGKLGLAVAKRRPGAQHGDLGVALEHLEAGVDEVMRSNRVCSLVALSTTCTGVVTLPQSCSRPAIFSS